MIGTILYELLTLLLAAAIVLHAAYGVNKLLRAKTSVRNPEWIGAIGWLAIAIYMLTLWPNSSYPDLYPRSSFLFFVAIALFPAAIFRDRVGNARIAGLLGNLAKIGIAVLCVGLLYSAARYLIFVRPTIFCSDFAFYVCTARDMAFGFSDLSMMRYFYFPGIFTFWRIVLSLTDGGIDSLQWWYSGVIAANALLVGAIVMRTVRNFFASVIAALWYIVFCSRFDGFLGLSEPIATSPILLGLFFWGGNSFLGNLGLLRLFALGIGLGLSVYTRQMAGLVSLGAIGLIFAYLFQDRNRPIITLKRLIFLPIISTTVLVVSIFLEGYGLQPLVIGLQHLPEYGGTSDFWSVLWNLSGRVPVLRLFGLISLLVFAGCVLIPTFRPMILQPCWQILAFTSIGGSLSLLSHVGRASSHYAHFAGSMLIISSMIAFMILFRSIPVRYRLTPASLYLVAMIALLPFIRSNATTTLYVWPFSEQLIRPVRQKPWPLRPGPAADLRFIKSKLEPLEKIYVLPPSHNEIHFFLQTRFNTYQYAWLWYALQDFYSRQSFPGKVYYHPMPLADVLKTPGLQGVIVLNRKEISKFYADLSDRIFQYDRAEQILVNNNFEPIAEVPTMVLWRKRSKIKH